VAAGYALHIKEGHVAFAVRTGPDAAVTEIIAPSPIRGRASITATLAPNGMMSLSINEGDQATGKAARLIPRQPAENFCVGHDDARPVTEYTSKERFRGSIQQLQVLTK
jgi:hypothetical protein